ncbi:MAG: ABC transporter permease, partial [Candidatus Aminicenantes bacterium]
ALRNLKKYKFYSFINIAGLAIGMTCCILILLWVHDEITYDRFHEKSDNVYRVISENHSTDQPYDQWQTPGPLASALKEGFPEIIKSTRYHKNPYEILVRYKDTKFMEPRVSLADADLFEIFTFSFVKGDPKKALSDHMSIVITEEIAEKYFGSNNPIGKTLNMSKEFNFTVTGVIKKPPPNSHFQFDFLIPVETIKEYELGKETLESWNIYFFETYVLLQKRVPFQGINQKIHKYLRGRTVEALTIFLHLQPLKSTHLYSSEIQPRMSIQGDIKYVYIFSIIALFILIIACINFMNLTTARHANRAQEVGLRKVVGANRTELLKQFFGESILLSFISLVLAAALVELFLPAFRNLTEKHLAMFYAGNIKIIFAVIAIALFTGVLSGIYPALFLSSFQPVTIFRGSYKLRGGGSLFRKILVVMQFSFSILLIICTIVVSSQVGYMRNHELGFDKEHLLYIPIRGELWEKYESMKNELMKNPEIINVTATSNVPLRGTSRSGPTDRWKGKSPDKSLPWKLISVSHDYIEILNLKMIQGRNFSAEFPSDSSQVVINETASKAIGTESPIGLQFTFWGDEYTIMGVVEDYHYSPLNYEIGPLILAFKPEQYQYILFKIRSENIPDTLKYIERTCNQFESYFPFEYRFLDESYNALYKKERRLGKIFINFALLAISISCLGLFGLASFMAEQRTKEIGIRKALGAPVGGIVLLLSKEFTKWVLLANIIAWPIAYYIMAKWLENFPYRMSIGLWIFVISGAIAFVIAVITVIFQALRAALANPVDALRYE